MIKMNMIEYMNLIIQKIEEKTEAEGYESEQQFLDMIQENPKAEIGYLMGQRSIIGLIAQIAPMLLEVGLGEEE
tara:strand:+ start:11200 stop:11421 length:222 start_codon:yes stop_codon:yes gene_type:complete